MTNLQPDSAAHSHYLKGLQLFGERKLDQAMACFELSIATDPAAPEGYNGKGAVLYAEGAPEAAIAEFNKAIRRMSIELRHF
jgi:tetratricopeptide (TPR) repeat protein